MENKVTYNLRKRKYKERDEVIKRIKFSQVTDRCIICGTSIVEKNIKQLCGIDICISENQKKNEEDIIPNIDSDVDKIYDVSEIEETLLTRYTKEKNINKPKRKYFNKLNNTNKQYKMDNITQLENNTDKNDEIIGKDAMLIDISIVEKDRNVIPNKETKKSNQKKIHKSRGEDEDIEDEDIEDDKSEDIEDDKSEDIEDDKSEDIEDEDDKSEDIEDDKSEDIESENEEDKEYNEEEIEYEEEIKLDGPEEYKKYLERIGKMALDKEKINNVENEEKLRKIIEGHTKREITLEKILKSEICDERKYKLFHEWLIMKSTDRLTPKYKEYLEHIRSQIWDYEDIKDDLREGEREILERMKEKEIKNEINMKKIISSELPDEILKIVLEKYSRMQLYYAHSDEYQTLDREIREQLESWKPEYREEFANITEKEEKTYEEQLYKSKLPKNVKSHIYRELKHFREINKTSEDYSKQKYWLDYALSLPTNIKEFPVKKNDSTESKIQFEKHIKQKLNQSCYGMSEVKDLLLDYVFQKISNPTAIPQILVLSGPPGIGKTTLARSLASSLNLDFISINMGGIRDSAKLIGHSKTYIGAIPGEIIRGLSKCTSINPMIYLDEVDKIAHSSNTIDEIEGVLTHLLDPSQNSQFVDEYLGFPFDLSKVFWVITINKPEYLNSIVSDRLFIVPVSGYQFSDKISMAKDYLLPTIYSNLGYDPLSPPFSFSDSSLQRILNSLPTEPGVRSFQKHLQFLANRLNRLHNLSSSSYLLITPDIVDDLLSSLPKTHDPTLLWII